jgi:hypothetical protein
VFPQCRLGQFGVCPGNTHGRFAGALPKALFRTRTGDPLLTMNVRRGSAHAGLRVAVRAGLCVSPVVASPRLTRPCDLSATRTRLRTAHLSERRLAHAIAIERPYDRRRCQRFRVAQRDPDETLTVVLSKAPARRTWFEVSGVTVKVEDVRHFGRSCSPSMKISRRSRSRRVAAMADPVTSDSRVGPAIGLTGSLRWPTRRRMTSCAR